MALRKCANIMKTLQTTVLGEMVSASWFIIETLTKIFHKSKTSFEILHHNVNTEALQLLDDHTRVSKQGRYEPTCVGILYVF